MLVGGGSSHDFVKFFGATDKATLTPVCGWVDFTQNLNGIPAILKDIDVLVLSANQPISTETFPQVWIVKHPKARIVGMTLGHDARAHDLPAYQTLLKNAVIWAGGK